MARSTAGISRQGQLDTESWADSTPQSGHVPRPKGPSFYPWQALLHRVWLRAGSSTLTLCSLNSRMSTPRTSAVPTPYSDLGLQASAVHGQGLACSPLSSQALAPLWVPQNGAWGLASCISPHPGVWGLASCEA